jgi:hypothetical protein
MTWLLIWLLCAIAAGIIGSKKGEGGAGFMLGFLFGPFGILFAYLMKGNRHECPACRSLIHEEATVCPMCRSAIEIRQNAAPNLSPNAGRGTFRDHIDRGPREPMDAATKRRLAFAIVGIVVGSIMFWGFLKIYDIECSSSQPARAISPNIKQGGLPPSVKQDRLPPTKSETTRSANPPLPNMKQGRPSPTESELARSRTDVLQKNPPLPNMNQGRSSPTESELARSRTDVLQKIKETRAGTEKLLALHEATRQQLLEEYNRRRELYNQGLTTRNDILQAERALAEAMIRVEEDKRWLVETD